MNSKKLVVSICWEISSKGENSNIEARNANEVVLTVLELTDSVKITLPAIYTYYSAKGG